MPGNTVKTITRKFVCIIKKGELTENNNHNYDDNKSFLISR